MHIMKLVVGADSLQDFSRWQQQNRYDYCGQEANLIYTRNMPRQAEEILKQQGSAYRVIKGVICCRQQILGFKPIMTDYGPKCLIYTDTQIIRTRPVTRRAFQGWRYLKPEAAPEDIGPYQPGQEDTSSELEAELMALGIL